MRATRSLPEGLCQGGLCQGVSVREIPNRPHGQTDACENITLSQTSFAGGNKKKESVFFIVWVIKFLRCLIW